MNINLFKIGTLLLVGFLTITSCGADDENSNVGMESILSNNERLLIDCPKSASDQVVQGNFKGIPFVSPGGSYRDQSFGGEEAYSCRIYIKSPLGTGDCAFPKFEGYGDTILFSLNSLEPQTFEISDQFNSESQAYNNTLKFNRISEDDGTTIVELSCGVITITEYDALTGELFGTVVAKGMEGSTIDGNFVLDFCDKSIF